MTNDNEETRSWEQLAADNKQLRKNNEVLQLKLGQAQSTIADYERAAKVAEAMAVNNDVLDSWNSCDNCGYTDQ